MKEEGLKKLLPDKYTPLLPADPSWERARQWARNAERFGDCARLAGIMCGLELHALHANMCVRPGNPQLSSAGQLGGAWGKKLREELHLPRSTAHIYMAMAEAVAPHLMRDKRLARVELLTTPLDSLPRPTLKLLEGKIRSLTEDLTQSEVIALHPARQGGDRRWERWLTTHHPELIGANGRVPSRRALKLTHPDVIAAFEAATAGQPLSVDEQLTLARQAAAAAWRELAEQLSRAQRAESWKLLPATSPDPETPGLADVATLLGELTQEITSHLRSL